MNPFQHVIWDWNGTLLDDTQAGVNAMLPARGLPPLDVPAYRDIFGFPVRDFYRAVGFRLEAEDWDAMAREFHDRFLADTTLRLHADAARTLACLEAAGIGQSVLSASEQTILETMLADFGVARFFAHVCGVDNLYGHSKLELGRSLLRRLGLPPGRVLRMSHLNPQVQKLYADYLDKPLSEKAHHLLHNHYHAKKIYAK